MLGELIVDRSFVVVDQNGDIVCTIEDDYIPYELAYLEVLNVFDSNDGIMLVVVYR